MHGIGLRGVGWPVRALGGGGLVTPPWYLAGGISAANCLAAYQPKGAADLAASYVNLANPGTYDATPGVAPTFDPATGWVFNSGGYLKTGLIPPNDQSWSALIRFVDYAVNPVYALFFGATGAAPQPRFGVGSWVYNANAAYCNGGTTATGGPLAAAEVIGIAGSKGYRGGAFVADISTVAGTIPELYIGAQNENGSAANHVTAKILAFACYDTVLTPAQVAAVSAAMAAL